MEWLLPEIAVEVAQYLTVRDLSALCAVSTHWREVFGTDQIWQQWCDPDLEEHLRTTPCLVQPAFSVSGDRDSTLAPVSRSRSAFLREQHLWSNWRDGRCRAVEHSMEKMKMSLDIFVANNFLVSFFKDSVELRDLRVIPPVQLDRLVLDGESYYETSLFRNNLIVVKSTHDIKILMIDVGEATITMQYQIYVDVDKTPVLVDPRFLPEHLLPSNVCHVDIHITPGSKCIIYSKLNEEQSFHVWDLDSGVLLKEERCPSRSFNHGMRIAGSKSCDNVMVMYGESVGPQTRRGRVECRMYNVEQQYFFKLNHIVYPYDRIHYNPSLICAITNKFVAISEFENPFSQRLRIFNYETGQQLHQLNAVSPVDIIDDSYFVFVTCKSSVGTRHKTCLCFVECGSGKIAHEVEDIQRFQVLGKKLIETNGSSKFPTIWNISRLSGFKALHVTSYDCKETNQTGTRLIEYRSIFDAITISHYW